MIKQDVQASFQGEVTRYMGTYPTILALSPPCRPAMAQRDTAAQQRGNPKLLRRSYPKQRQQPSTPEWRSGFQYHQAIIDARDVLGT